MSDPVLSQLVSVEDDLAEQAETLEAKLNQLREQRQGLRTVIDMFQAADGDPPLKGIAVPPSGSSRSADDTEADDTEIVSQERLKAKKSKSTAAKETTKSGRKATVKSVESTKGNKTSTQRKKKDGRAATWQKYVQSIYRETALPEAVSSVLRSQPSEVFTIADVMSSIFS